MNNQNQVRRTIHAASIAVLSLAALGCDPKYEKLSIEVVSRGPLEVIANSDEVIIPAGIATTISVQPISGNVEEYPESTHVDLSSHAEKTLLVYPTPEYREFTLVGVSPGRTCLVVRVSGDEKECLRVRVVSAVETVLPEQDEEY